MRRILDLSVRGYSCPPGDGGAAIRPVYSNTLDSPPTMIEHISDKRTIAEILSYHKVRLSMCGGMPGEIYSYGTLTTKPHCTYATYYNPGKNNSEDVKYISDLPCDNLVGCPVVIDLEVKKGEVISLDKLRKTAPDIEKGDIVFLRTGYSEKNRKAIPTIRYYEDSPTLSKEATEWIAQKGIKVLGSDTRTLSLKYASQNDTFDSYRILNSKGIVVVEDLANLGKINRRHNLCIVGIPLRIRGVTGGPARVFVFDEENTDDFVDCSHPLDRYPGKNPDSPYPFEPPKTERSSIDEIGDYPNPILPGRTDPRDDFMITSRRTRLTPFQLRKDNILIGNEMYIEYGNQTTTHIEGPFFDPWGRHNIPNEIMRKYVRMPADKLIGKGCLIDVSDMTGPRQMINSYHLKQANPDVRERDIVFLRTGITDWYFYGPSINCTSGLSPDAAQWLIRKKIKALVIDSPSCELSDPASEGSSYSCSNMIHYHFHRHDIPMVDHGINFGNIMKNRFVAGIMSLPASHQSIFPAHVVVIEEW